MKNKAAARAPGRLVFYAAKSLYFTGFYDIIKK